MGVRITMICVGPQSKDDFELRMNYAMNLWFLHAPRVPLVPPPCPPPPPQL